MIKGFIEKWLKYNKDLESYLRNHNQSEYATYEQLVEILIKEIINKDEEFECNTYNINEIVVLDHGDYQGTQIFILHKNVYQPEPCDYIYTNTYYGSCSRCDTLLQISNYDTKLPNEHQIKGYMNLMLNLLQKFRRIEEY